VTAAAAVVVMVTAAAVQGRSRLGAVAAAAVVGAPCGNRAAAGQGTSQERDHSLPVDILDREAV